MQQQNHTRKNRKVSGFAPRIERGKYNGRTASQCKETLLNIISEQDITLRDIETKLSDTWCKRTLQKYLREMRTANIIKLVAVNGQRSPVYRVVLV